MFNSGYYPCNLQQEEIFVAPIGWKILLTITFIHTEELYDVLKIGYGDNPMTGKVAEYSGGPLNEIKILSEGNKLWLTFTSDGSVNLEGFTGIVQPINGSANGDE